MKLWKNSCFIAAAALALAAPAFAQDAGFSAPTDAKTQVQAPADVYLRNGTPMAPAAQGSGQVYLNNAPINMKSGAYAPLTPQYQADNANAYAADTDAYAQAQKPDYSASAYNTRVTPVTIKAKTANVIPDPFPSWFGSNGGVHSVLPKTAGAPVKEISSATQAQLNAAKKVRQRYTGPAQ